MTKSVLEFDEVAADDALIEAIRSGAGIDDVPADDPAAGLLVALRDGADLPVASPVRDARGVRRIVGHRRLVASGVAACVMVVAGVGAAVAGDPTAAFTYVFRQGVDLGSRFGSPADEHAQAPIGGGIETARLAGPGSPPVRQGSAAAPWVDDGVREPLGYEHQPRDWNGPAPDDIGSYADDDLSTSDRDAAGENQPNESVPTRYPESDDSTSPPDDDSYGPQSEDPPDESVPPNTYGPTESEPTSPVPTEPTTPTPTESAPTPTSPTESEPTPTSPPPTTSSPTPSPTSSPTSSPSESAPTGTQSPTPTTTESVPTP